MNQIRSRINALRRKMALEISVVRLRPLVAAGFYLPTFMAAHKYPTRCLTENVVPGVEHLLGALLPWATVRGLVVLSDDPTPMPGPQSA